MDPGGLDVLVAGLQEFADRVKRENHTLKRALTDPRLFSGIGNAYSDEILHRAKLSPFAQTASLSEEDVRRLCDATRATLAEWTERLRKEAGAAFPEKVTAFREGMAVDGGVSRAPPGCGPARERLRFPGDETDYFPPLSTRRQV